VGSGVAAAHIGLWTDFGVLAATLAAWVAISAKLHPNIVR